MNRSDMLYCSRKMRPSNLFQSRILDQQAYIILDGAMGTALEAVGATLDPLLWSAGVVMTDPDKIKEVHRRYFEAGADIATAASYQATIEGFMKKGCSSSEAEDLLRRSVTLAVEARDEYWERHQQEQKATHSSNSEAGRKGARVKPLVAASIGCYGAALADGSEYSGDYGLTKEELMNWHRPRLKILAKAGADLLAFETIPCIVELEAYLQLLKEEDFRDVRCWMSLSLKDSTNLNSGDSLEEAANLVVESDPPYGSQQVLAFGINCTAPHHVEDAIDLLRVHSSGRLIVVYPNSGEVWKDKTWKPASGVQDPEVFAEMARKWAKNRATMIGGCCRTDWETIAAIRKKLLG